MSELDEMYAKVRNFIQLYLRKKNLYGWHYYVDDLCTDVYLYMRETMPRKPELGIGAYCNFAKIRASNYAAECSTNKRRANFDVVPFYDSIPVSDVHIDEVTLFESVSQECGAEIAKLLISYLETGSRRVRGILKKDSKLYSLLKS